VHDHPECEEELAEERAPGLVTVVDRVGDSSHHAHEVEDENGGRGHQQRRPLESVQLPEVVIVASLRSHGEVRVDPREHLEQALEERE